MVLHPDMRTIIDMMASSGAAPMEAGSVADARLMASAMTQFGGSGPPVDAVHNLMIPRTLDSGVVPARLFTPSPPLAGAIVYFHGGGWVLGDLDGYDALARVLAVESHCAVFLVDYRLAPESRFPAAVMDCLDAVHWLDTQTVSLFGAPLPLIVAGDSAGGNLAAVVAQRAHPFGKGIAAQVLVYPVMNADFATASYAMYADGPLLTRATMQWFWDHYLPDAARRRDPMAAPDRYCDLTGLPPAIVVTAEVDPLRDEGEAYADALAAAGLTVARHRFDGVTHGFFGMVNLVASSRRAIRFVASELQSLLEPPASP
jgi:acetyl esterase